MSFEFIDSPAGAERVLAELSGESSIALDLEAAGFHRYSDRACLVQISTAGGRDLILDPLAFDVGPLLKPLLEDPSVEVLMHGSDFDLRLLDRDFDIHPTALFDTQAAAQVLGERAIGLASLLENFLDVKLAKKYQRADWAQRPLPGAMLDYAVNDTRYLHRLVEVLRGRLEAAGRTHWAHEECRQLETIRHEDDADLDPVTRVKGARDLSPREVSRLREAIAWRDGIARAEDRAPFRVASDQVLIEAALLPPKSAEDLAGRKGMNAHLARTEGESLVERLATVDRLGPDELTPYPRPKRDGRGRPPPEVEEVADRLKAIRNRAADELGLDRGTLLPNAVVLETAFQSPGSLSDLGEIPGIKKWQIEAVGEQILAALDTSR